jgi:YidC/Oxa1 family membrane protein insertase
LAEYRNPQTEPGSEKRLLLIFLISFVFMLLAQPLLKKYFPTPPPQKTAQTRADLSVRLRRRSQQHPRPPWPRLTSAPAVTKQAAAETKTVIESDLYRVTFTNRGAQVKSWILKKFDNDAENGKLDLVNSTAATQYGYPLSLWAYDEELRGRLNSALYVAKQDGRQITFEYSDPDLTVRKVFKFDDTYVVKVDASVTYKGSPKESLLAWPSGFGDQASPARHLRWSLTSSIRISSACLALQFWFSKCTSGGETTTPGPSTGRATDQYFAAIPDDPAAASMLL